MLILKNGKFFTMAGGVVEGDVAITNGRITAVGSVIPTEDDEVVDLGGRIALPGIVDAHCHIGMWGDGMGFEGADGNESTDPVTPSMRAIDGVNPQDNCFKEAYTNGITSAVTGPGSANVIGGTFIAMKTYGRCVDEMLIKNPAAMKMAFGENPKRVYNDQEKSPITRMAIAALIRETLSEAQEYADKLELGDEDKQPDKDLKLEALLPVLDGTLMVKAHAHRADDIMSAIRIAKEFNLKMTIEHCTEGYMIADLLKKEDVGIILGPLISERCKIELRNLTLKAPKMMYDAGIKFAIMSDHPVVPVQHLRVCAALAVREGLPAEEALKAITINAAQITGLDERIGSIEVGKDGDIAVFSGDPLDIRTRCVMTVIEGKIVHDELR